VTSEEKNVPFEKASCGMLGLQTAFPISLCSLVCTEKIDLYRLYELMSKVPAEIVGRTAEIKVGAPASFAVCDIDSEYTFEQSMLISDRLVSNSPYLGQVLIGKILKLF
jgi:dihydroorotase